MEHSSRRSSRPSATAYPGGAQTVRRAFDVLRYLAAGGPNGWPLREVAAAAGLAKGTAHRLLQALVAEAIVEQEPATRRYRLSVDLLGLRPELDWYQPLRRLAEPTLRHLAEELGDTVFLSVRNGFDALCVACEFGGYPIRSFPYNVGERRPLGVGASGLAILGAMEPAQADHLIHFNRARLKAYKHFSPEQLHAMAAAARAEGYSLIDGLIVPGMVAIGVACRDPAGRPSLAISAAAIADRMPPKRRATVVGALRRSREAIEKAIRAQLREAGMPAQAMARRSAGAPT